MSDAHIEILRPFGVVVAVDRDNANEIVPPASIVFEARFEAGWTKRALIEMVAGAVKCPEPYGRNWDALHEVLRTMDWYEWESVVLRWTNARELLSLTPSAAVTLIKVLSNSSLFWKRKGRAFLTLLEGDKELYGLVENVLTDWHLHVPWSP